MYSLYALGVQKRRAPLSLTPVKPKLSGPTTVRFPEEVAEWLRIEGLQHPEGAAGVIRDAVAAARHAKVVAEESLRNHLLGAMQ